jgi:predicted SAM-dependent methyltransferase
MQMIKLSFGSGGVVLPGWTHVDINPECNPDLLLDATKPMPFDEGSVDFLHSEDFVDQLSLSEGEAFVRECRRIIKPEGVMRLLTVDLQRLVDLYVRGDQRLLSLWEQGVGIPLRTRTLGEVLNEGMRQCGHRFVYDEETLRVLLESNGFRVQRVECNQSEYPELRGLDLRQPDNALSMYFECRPV